jgi:hypothetical protein
MSAERPRPEWWVLADATLAGLSVLIPLPGLDLLVEAFFRHRIAPSIARHRHVRLETWILARLGSGGEWLTLHGCLLLPLRAVIWLVKRLVRKLLYVLTVAEAAEQISAYWHRAFLVDHLVRSGCLQRSGPQAERAIALFRQVLEEADTSPLVGLARQVAGSPRRALRVLQRLRRGEAVPTADQAALDAGWPAIQASLAAVAARFDRLVAAPPPPPAR